MSYTELPNGSSEQLGHAGFYEAIRNSVVARVAGIAMVLTTNVTINADPALAANNGVISEAGDGAHGSGEDASSKDAARGADGGSSEDAGDGQPSTGPEDGKDGENSKPGSDGIKGGTTPDADSGEPYFGLADPELIKSGKWQIDPKQSGKIDGVSEHAISNPQESAQPEQSVGLPEAKSTKATASTKPSVTKSAGTEVVSNSESTRQNVAPSPEASMPGTISGAELDEIIAAGQTLAPKSVGPIEEPQSPEEDDGFANKAGFALGSLLIATGVAFTYIGLRGYFRSKS